MRTVSNEPWASINLRRDFGIMAASAVVLACVLYCVLLALIAVGMVPWLLLRRAWARCCSYAWCPLLLLCGACLTAEAATTLEPLSYSLWGKRYFVPAPERQLWSQHEVAMFSMTSPADPSRRWLRGVEFKQARVRGQAGDTNGHNYLVVAIKTGARIITPTEAAAKKKGGKWAGGQVGMVTLTWADVPGWTPHWSGLPMMPDGEPRFWGIYSSTNLADWQFEDRVATNIWTTPNLDTPAKFYVVRWRG